MELLLIRHGEPVRIEGGDGPADPVLHDRGHEQAERLADYLASEAIDGIYTSPMRRASQTAAPLAAARNLSAVVDEALAEYDRHATFYVPVEELRALKDERWQAMVAGDYSMYGIDPVAFRATVVETMERIVEAHPGGRVAVVCHGGVINAYVGFVVGIDRLGWYNPDYTSLNRIAASRGGVRSVLALNETAHLRGTGLLHR